MNRMLVGQYQTDAKVQYQYQYQYPKNQIFNTNTNTWKIRILRAFKLKVHFSRAGNFSGNNFHKIEIISRAWKFSLEFQKGCTFFTGFQQPVNR